MPLKQCTKNGKSGWKFGDSGTCYTGPEAKEKARKQGVAIKISQKKANGTPYKEWTLEELGEHIRDRSLGMGDQIRIALEINNRKQQ